MVLKLVGVLIEHMPIEQSIKIGVASGATSVAVVEQSKNGTVIELLRYRVNRMVLGRHGTIRYGILFPIIVQ